jgi:Holliday junction resolvasome RuvABC endonuclease subunit
MLRLSHEGLWSMPETHTIRPPKLKGRVTGLYEAQRLLNTIEVLDHFGVFRDPTLVAIEQYAYGIGKEVTNCIFELGELGGCVRFHLFEGKVPWTEVPIQTNKAFLTGNGAARKDKVAAAVAEYWGLPQFEESEHDASDALSLATVAAFFHLSDMRGKRMYKFWPKAVEKLEVIRER